MEGGAPNAIDDAFGDIMGLCVVQWAHQRGLAPRPPPSDFAMSADLYRDGKCAPGALRWMRDPFKDGQSFNCWDPVIDKEVG